jgi:hypothetical protein
MVSPVNFTVAVAPITVVYRSPFRPDCHCGEYVTDVTAPGVALVGVLVGVVGVVVGVAAGYGA